MGVVEECQAVGGEVDYGGYGGFKARAGLQGQAVDEVAGDGVVAVVAGACDHVADVFKGLDAVDGTLHVGVDVLYAEADAVEAHVAQGFEIGVVHGARVDFDAVFAFVFRGKTEMVMQEGEDVTDFVRA